MTEAFSPAAGEGTSSRRWYDEGLRFACTRCGRCCRGSGIVELSDAEIIDLAAALDMSESDFRASHTRPLRRGRIALIDGDHDACIFYHEDIGCRVYASRPAQCRAYPFWPSLLLLAESWREEAICCPGIGEGEVLSRDEIEARVDSVRDRGI